MPTSQTSPTWQQATDAFLRRDLAAGSRRVYRLTLDRVGLVLGAGTPVDEISGRQVAEALDTAYPRAAPASWNRHVATVRSFTAFAQRQGWLDRDLTPTKLSRLRTVIAKRMVESLQVSAQLTTGPQLASGRYGDSTGVSAQILRANRRGRSEQPTPLSEPVGIAFNEGAAWVNSRNNGDATVSRIDPSTNKVVATVPVGTRSDDLWVDAGSVWTIAFEDQVIDRIDPWPRPSLRPRILALGW